MKKVSVVGGGIGGLAVAIRMAIRGYNAVSYTHLTLPTKA